MFPALKSTVSGLEPAAKYYILLDLCLADDSRYKWTGAEWQVAGKAEPQMPSRFFIHPDSPATGAQWMKHDISFQKVKLTNNNMDPNGHVSQSSPSVEFLACPENTPLMDAYASDTSDMQLKCS